jgi:hypothetical protein
MPALPIIADTYRIAFIWSGYGSNAVNVMHFRKAGSSAGAVGTSVIASWQLGQLQCVGNSSSIDTLHVTPLDGISASVDLATGSAGKWVGFAAGDVIPAQSGIVKLATASRGRSYRGRVFLPWTAESAATVGIMSAGIVTSLEFAWTAFLAALNAAGVTWVIASYKHATAAPITTITVEQALGTQRRRQTRYRP